MRTRRGNWRDEARISGGARGVFRNVFCNAGARRGYRRLKGAPNGHFLQYEDGRPFFWLADTAWLMFNKLTPDEIKTYLHDRHEQGFNVVQVLVIRGGDE